MMHQQNSHGEFLIDNRKTAIKILKAAHGDYCGKVIGK